MSLSLPQTVFPPTSTHRMTKPANNRIYLQVPFAEKGEAKKHGAR